MDIFIVPSRSVLQNLYAFFGFRSKECKNDDNDVWYSSQEQVIEEDGLVRMGGSYRRSWRSIAETSRPPRPDVDRANRQQIGITKSISREFRR